MISMPDLSGREWLRARISATHTFLTVGLDSDPARLPAIIHHDVLAFNKIMIDATRDLCVSYKINFAFYEAMGLRGWEILKETIHHIGDQHLIIADAKRGDIGNTAAMYAKAVFDELGCHAITVNPYMGEDTVTPFYKENKWVILLGLTSNTGSADFQKMQFHDGSYVYEHVMRKSATWGNADNTMYVIGATHPDALAKCRAMLPDHFFLIPGVGAQGGDLEEVLKAGINSYGGLLINASRSILYASQGDDFAEKGRAEAMRMNQIMAPYTAALH